MLSVSVQLPGPETNVQSCAVLFTPLQLRQLLEFNPVQSIIKYILIVQEMMNQKPSRSLG